MSGYFLVGITFDGWHWHAVVRILPPTGEKTWRRPCMYVLHIYIVEHKKSYYALAWQQSRPVNLSGPGEGCSDPEISLDQKLNISHKIALHDRTSKPALENAN